MSLALKFDQYLDQIELEYTVFGLIGLLVFVIE